MLTFRDIRQAHVAGPTVLTIGNFDGIHLGHQALLQRVIRVAEDLTVDSGQRALTGLLTFDPHPITLLRPDQPNLLLTTPRERLVLAAERGIDLGIIHPFTRETAGFEAAEFVALLRQHLGLAALVVGPDFALGRNRSGNIERLRALGGEYDFQVIVAEPYLLDETPVRSSWVRQELQAGDVSMAARLLGRPYRVTGPVGTGDQRGRTVGIPTANIAAPTDKLLPADGVYATRSHVLTFDCAMSFNSVTNIGVRPTVDGLHRRVETHLLGFPGRGQIDDLYGETVAVEFIQRLRGEQRFADVGALVRQIHSDIAQAEELFGSKTLS